VPRPATRILLSLLFVSGALLCAGCGSATTYITSEPTGATIWYNGTRAGVAPVTYEVETLPGPYRVYTFTATKSGYEESSKSFEEITVWDGANDTVPPNIHFELKPRKGTQSP
jgi:hypothetical protein